MPRYVIIGNGIAGVSAAETIRSLDPDSPLLMIAAEEFPPYSRPMISLVLEGAVTPDRLVIRPPDFYQRLGIEALVGHKVVELDPQAARLHTDRGESLAYDRLLIASGADPRPVEAPGSDLAGIFYMRTEAQVRGMLEMLPGASTGRGSAPLAMSSRS